MNRLSTTVLLLAAFLAGTPALAWQRGVQQPPSSSSLPRRIHGKIRLPGGRPAPQGMLVSLEAASGGIAGQTQSDSAGNFEFTMMQPDLYVVRVKQPGYQDVAEQVDLRTNPTAYLNIEARPIPPSPQSAMPPEGPGAAVSATAVEIPAQARKNLSEGKELLEKRKDFEKSIRFFKKAIEEYPKYVEAYLLMGVAYSAQKRWNDAATALNHAIEVDSKYAPAYLALGALENQQGKFADAEKPLLKAVELNADSANVQWELARAYWGLGRWQDADPHAAKAVELAPDNSDAHLLMGNILLRKRDAAGALREYKESLRLAPNGPMSEPTRQMVAKLEAALKSSQEKPAK